MRGDELSLAQARRIVLHAQGFGRDYARADLRTLLSLVRSLGTVQIDSVNVLVRSHYLPAFSRLGPYDRALLERLAYRRPRRLFEYWGHEASLLPIELYPLFRWRMARAGDGRGTWKHVAQMGLGRRDFVRRVRAAFEQNGAMSASDFGDGKGTGSWWGWNDTKRAVEYLFWAGDLAVVERRSSFERVYDLAERVIPADVRDAPALSEDEQQRRLLVIAARALGVATEADLRDFFRLDAVDGKRRVDELVRAGSLKMVAVEGWKNPAYIEPGRRVPRTIETSAVLSPFDSVVWNRARTHRLFDFHYRIEIYTPPHKRVHGYYVLPYLADDRLVARVDLKADRAASTLRVHAIHYEPRIDRSAIRARLDGDLRSLAQWLQLDRIAVGSGRTRQV